MSRRKIKAGSTSQILPVFIQDTSSTTGAGLGSLVYNTASLAAKYRRQGDSSWTSITLVTATAGTFTSGGFVADGGSVTGGYEIGLPNAMLASGATWAQLQIYGATNMLPVLVEFELDAIDYQDTVRLGLTALPNVASGSSGGLIIQGTGTTGLDVSSGKVLLQATQTGVTIPTVTNLTNAPTSGDFTATMKTSITTAATAATPSVTVSDKTGFKLASDGLAAVTTWTVGITGDITGNVSGSVGSVSGAVGSVTGNVGGNVVGSVGSVSGAVGSVTGNVGGNVTGSVGSVVAGVSVSGTIATLDALNTSLSTTHGAGSWATATGFSTLDASGVRTAVGLASANLDTQLDALPTAAENSTAVWAAVTRSLTDKTGFSLATAPPTADENAAALLDLANAIESGLTVRQAMRLIVAAEAGKVSGGGTTTVTIRDIADTKDRIVATVDSDGNRTAITRDLT